MNNSADCLVPISEEGPALPAENKGDALERHRRKCKVCCHPDLEDIEQDYRDWAKPAQIAK